MAIREIPDALMGETYFRIRMRQGKKKQDRRGRRLEQREATTEGATESPPGPVFLPCPRRRQILTALAIRRVGAPWRRHSLGKGLQA